MSSAADLHVLYQIANAPLRLFPFPHIYVNDVVRANLPALLAKGSPHGRACVLPEAARADGLIALTRAQLEPGRETADWILLKAQVKARAMRRALRWARGILGT
jgi:hypothetical protein